MTKSEILSYVQSSSRRSVCVSRERCLNIDLIVKSIYITGKQNALVVAVEFDPITLVEEGEGWIWHSEPCSLDDVVHLLESSFGKSLEDWENVTKSGKLLYEHESLDLSGYGQVSEQFVDEFSVGKAMLPKGFVWNYRE